MYNQYLLKVISELLLFISKHIPLKQWAFDDSHSPEYQKFKVDKLPRMFNPEPVDYNLLLAYYQHKYGKTVKPIKHKSENDISKSVKCPRCGAPHQYLYRNNGDKGQYECNLCHDCCRSHKAIYRHLRLQTKQNPISR